jgi:hypothetical protein
MKILIKTDNFSYKENSFEITLILKELDLNYILYIEENSITHSNSKPFYYKTHDIEKLMLKKLSHQISESINNDILKTLRSLK